MLIFLARKWNQDDSLEVAKCHIICMRPGTEGNPGRILYLPSGLSEGHFDIVKAALASDYCRDGDKPQIFEEHLMLKCDLSNWGIKYFDAAASWFKHDSRECSGDPIDFKDKPHHRHFDQVARRVRYLAFARDLGLDGMCQYIYESLKSLIEKVRDEARGKASYSRYRSGVLVRDVLEQSGISLRKDQGSTIQRTIDSELETIAFMRKHVQEKIENPQTPEELLNEVFFPQRMALNRAKKMYNEEKEDQITKEFDEAREEAREEAEKRAKARRAKTLAEASLRPITIVIED